MRTTKLVIQNGRCAYGMYRSGGGGVTIDVCAVSPTMPTISTQTPFGVVVASLRFQRRTLSSRLLFQPLPPGWEAAGELAFDGPATPPPHVLQHRAVLQTPDGRPFSLLVETYTDRVLAP